MFFKNVNPVELTCHMQVQCKAVVCPSQFKTQKFCEMLREICPEINSTPLGMIKSSRFDSANVGFNYAFFVTDFMDVI